MKRAMLCALSVGLMANSLYASGNQVNFDLDVIYGNDDRREIYDSKNDPKFVNLARSTAILIRSNHLKAENDQVSIPTETFGSTVGVCKEEPYYSEPNPGFCSGFLVGPDLFATAGHCITSQSVCDGTSMVFDYGYDHQGKDLSTAESENVFRCKSIVSRAQEDRNGIDYAIVKLDRPVSGREPLKIRRAGQIAVGTDVTVIGNPVGLPTKIAGGAKVRSNKNEEPFFMANLDTYGGNSGSAVFNNQTGLVEGILVRGETDFISKGDCRISNRCADDKCRGEDVTKSPEFAKFIP